LKTSRIIPLHKKGEKCLVENYRPIANLNSLGKLYEKLLLSRLDQETAGMEGSFQHAYRRSHSTTTALLELQSRVANMLEQKMMVAVYSMDLSAAFDLLRPPLMQVVLKSIGTSQHLRWLINDFLTSRSFFVEVNGTASEPKNMNIGCVQGSILGPRLFTLYLGKLAEKIDHQDIVTYADDSYVVITGRNMEELKSNVEQISHRHVAFLKEMGMAVNPSKTEVIVFNKIPIRAPFSIDGTMVESGVTMKALGITWQHDLKWTTHLEQISRRLSPKLSMLKKIRKNLDLQQFLKIATSQLFSVLYYASQLWMNETLCATGWKKLRSIHYRILRAAVRDFKQRKSKIELDATCKRVTPKIWSSYSTASLVIKIKRDRSPNYLHETIQETLYTTRRQPDRAKFYDNSRGKIGKHRLSNRLMTMNDLPAWMDKMMTDDAIRIFLKKHFNFSFN